jgi:hypothetical protein
MRRGLRLLPALVLAAGAGAVLAQFPEGSRGGWEPLPNARYDGKFTFARIRYATRMERFRDQPWAHDYPRAEAHFGKLLSELSYTRTHLGGGNVFSADDPELFRYPIAYMSEPGWWAPSPPEAEALRRYLLKGGFLIFDDFAGNEWYNFEEQMRRVLPTGRLVRLDVSHPVFDSFFRIESLEFWHPYRPGMKSEFWGIFEDNDPARRLLVLANYNNDVAEYWEWSDTDFAPIELTNEAYKLGINYVIYAMTH